MKLLFTLLFLSTSSSVMADTCIVVIRDQYNGYEYDQFTRTSYSSDAACTDAIWDCRNRLSEYQVRGQLPYAQCAVKTIFHDYPDYPRYPDPIPPRYPRDPYPPRYPDPIPPRYPRDPYPPRYPDPVPPRYPRDPYPPRDPRWPREPREPRDPRPMPPRDPHGPRLPR